VTAEPRRGVPQPGCEPCWGLWHRWLDYTMPPAPIRLDGTGIRSARDVGAAQERRYQDWRDTIRAQQALIAEGCWAGNHYRPKVPAG
jgi:hypothetical protein